MKKSFVFAAVAALMAFAACNKEEEPAKNPFGDAKVDLTTKTVEFTAEGGEARVVFVATRDWKVTGAPEWAAVSPAEGKASLEEQVVTVSVGATDVERSAEVSIEIEGVKVSFTVSQAAPEVKELVLTGTEWRAEVADMPGYGVAFRFTENNGVIYAEYDPEDGFWDDYPMALGVYVLDGVNIVINLWGDEEFDPTSEPDLSLTGSFADGVLSINEQVLEEQDGPAVFVEYKEAE